ncbi:unnamed protein product, partial [Sphenostylis stenocarpa]
MNAYWNKAKKEKTEAPTKEPTSGKAAEAPLLGPGAGAATSAVAMAELTEAAAMRTAQVTFLMSMMNKMRLCFGDPRVWCLRNNGALEWLLKIGFQLFWENTTFLASEMVKSVWSCMDFGFVSK